MERLTELAPGVRRLLAPNPSMMTGPGTNTYLFGDEQVAVIDPGPDLPEHLERIQATAGTIRWILVTHTHPDHSPGAARLAQATGAELAGMRAPEGYHQDQTFKPVREMKDGDVLDTAEFRLTAVHTPGHASNHLCFRHETTNWVVTGDHVINGSTVVINPPDGNMGDYLASLRRVRDLKPNALLPGHGDIIESPRDAIDWIIEHRLEREAKVVAALREHPACTSEQLVPHVYQDVPEHLYGWAERSLRAHLIKLVEEQRAECSSEAWSMLD